MAINTRPVNSLTIHNHLLLVTTDGNTTVNSKMAEIDMSVKQYAQIKFLVSKVDKLIKIRW
jgi:acetolactate synthase regulatory subunit